MLSSTHRAPDPVAVGRAARGDAPRVASRRYSRTARALARARRRAVRVDARRRADGWAAATAADRALVAATAVAAADLPRRHQPRAGRRDCRRPERPADRRPGSRRLRAPRRRQADGARSRPLPRRRRVCRRRDADPAVSGRLLDRRGQPLIRFAGDPGRRNGGTAVAAGKSGPRRLRHRVECPRRWEAAQQFVAFRVVR
jgi:hypothetical protein